MTVRQKYGTFVCNGLLFLIFIILLALFLLNLINNPQNPALRCDTGRGITEPNFSHRYIGDSVTTLTLLFSVVIAPCIQIIIMEWFCNKKQPYLAIAAVESSQWKRTLARASVLYKDYICGLVVIVFLNDIAKTTLNYPRPHWLESCKPSFLNESCKFGWLYDYKCTNADITKWQLADAKKSFPSGHSALTVYAACFMAIYQHCRIIRRMVLIWLYVGWLGYAIFCCLSRVLDKRHHPADVVFGGLLGFLGGLYSAFILSKGFTNISASMPSYHHNKLSSGLNHNPIIIDSLRNSSGNPVEDFVPVTNANGGPSYSGSEKRPSLRRLLSTQSTMTQMSEIAEDCELDVL